MKKLLSLLLATLTVASVTSVALAQEGTEDGEAYKHSAVTEEIEYNTSGISPRAVNKYTGKTYTHPSWYNSTDYTVENGIDVSYYQSGLTEDKWKRVKADGIKFAILRAGYRGYGKLGTLCKDSSFKDYSKLVNKVGIKLGVYMYSQAITVAEGVEEANYVLQQIKDAGCTPDLPIVVDSEFAYEVVNGKSVLTGRLYDAWKAGKLGKSLRTNILNAFCDTIKAAGYEPMIYLNESQLKNEVYADKLNYKLWLASYTTKANYTGQFDYWQYSSAGRVAGIDGNVDMDFRYVPTNTKPEETPKTAVTDFKVSARTGNSLTFTWSKPSYAPADYTFIGYRLYKYSEESKKYEHLLSETTNTSFEDVGLEPNTTYKYVIRALYKDASGKKFLGYRGSDYQFTTSPDQVTGVRFTSASTSAIKIAWTEVPGAVGYKVYRLVNGKYTLVGTIREQTCKFRDAELYAGTTYVYKVRAYTKVDGTTAFGSYSKPLETQTIPLAPSKLSAVTDSTKKIKFSWSAVPGAQGYKLYYYNTATKKYVLKKTVDASIRSATVSAPAKSRYKYTVKATKVVSGLNLEGSAVYLYAAPKSSGKVNTASLNVRTSPSTTGKIKLKITKGTKVKVIGASNKNWYKITFKKSGKTYTGYVAQKYVTIS